MPSIQRFLLAMLVGLVVATVCKIAGAPLLIGLVLSFCAYTIVFFKIEKWLWTKIKKILSAVTPEVKTSFREPNMVTDFLLLPNLIFAECVVIL